jgi:arylsulfatase A-like enzyme
VLALTGLPQLPDGDGRSLAGYMLGEPPPPSWTLSEYYGPPYFLRGIVEGHHKLIVDVANNAYGLFDLAADPGEQVDVAARHPDRVASLRARLDTWLETRADPSEPKRCL